MRTTRGTGRTLLVAALLAAPAAFGAGGHHAVDDATILPPGECEQEDWFTRNQGGERQLHAGFNCRAGPVELGLAGDHAHGGGGSSTAWNAEVKWARELAPGLALGVDLQPVWVAHRHPRHAMTRAVGIVTWNAAREVALHLNVGREFVRAGRDLACYGVAVDWSPRERLTFTGERFAEERTQFVRAGARWDAGRWKVDFSRAQRLAGPSPSSWTIGFTLAFGEE
ncbi:MAG TPA: hypothetical protein VFM98_04940 [Ramlibacter sp.]|uniref:hypothetical protein n=1 Tax=Ramlibacter sp. TaxID=1917967 RepID=UPI002D7F5563|nr:hypothetical protein [Ramlibacter sp.]HET8744925.1 hypothetical protein [Ramlibacter sp.]